MRGYADAKACQIFRDLRSLDGRADGQRFERFHERQDSDRAWDLAFVVLGAEGRCQKIEELAAERMKMTDAKALDYLLKSILAIEQARGLR